MKLAVFAGDASGDLQASYLMNALRSRVPHLDIWGVGGRRLQEAGARLLYDTSRASAIGIVQASKLIVPGLVTEKKAQRLLTENPPDLAIAVDFGAFNLRIAPYMRQLGIPVVYWFPPGSWRKTAPNQRVLQSADYFISPFPWYAQRLRGTGSKADFLGHPLLDQVRPKLSKEAFMEKIGLPTDSDLITLLPGSRGHEVHHILPPLIEAAALLTAGNPNLSFVVPLSDHFPADEASTLTKNTIERLKQMGLQSPMLALVKSATQEAICHSRAAAVCSGSATLEALVALVPMVVVYRGSKMMKFEYKLRRLKIQYMGMPNILADAPVDAPIVTELRQDDVTGANIAKELESLLEGPKRDEQIKQLQSLREMMEPTGAIERTADAVLDFYHSFKSTRKAVAG